MILVTGATGHIGNVLVRALLERNEVVRALILPGEDRQALDGLDLEQIEGNVCEPGSLEKACQGVEIVYHLAGIISISSGKRDFIRQVNVEGTRNVVQAVLNQGVKRLVYTSSIHAIERAPHGITIDESLPFVVEAACGEYDRTKAEASLFVKEATQHGLDAVIACPTGVIGPYDFRISEMGALILEFMRKKIQFWMDGAYDFVDVRDVARGLILAGERGRKGECYILSGEQIHVKSILHTVREAMGAKVHAIHIPMPLVRFSSRLAPLYYRLTNSRPLLTPYSLLTVLGNSVISSTKARRELGYSPRPVRESISDAVHWFQSGNQFIWPGV